MSNPSEPCQLLEPRPHLFSAIHISFLSCLYENIIDCLTQMFTLLFFVFDLKRSIKQRIKTNYAKSVQDQKNQMISYIIKRVHI